MRTVDHTRIPRRPGDPAIRRANHPLTQLRPALLRVEPVVRRQPRGQPSLRPAARASRRFAPRPLQNRLIRQRGKRGHQQAPFGRLDHPRVAVVNRAVQEHLRPAPAPPFVRRNHQLDPAKRTHMLFPRPRAHQQQLPVAPPGNGRPPMVILGLVADHLRLQHFDPRRGRGAPMRPHCHRASHKTADPQKLSSPHGKPGCAVHNLDDFHHDAASLS